jgi:chromosome segregation ATPase
MSDVDARLSSVEQRLEALGTRIDERFEQVDRRFEQVDRRFEQVDRRFGTLEAEVRKLRMLGEENASQIKVIAEVQAHHGSVHGAALARLEAAIKPLKELPAALQQILPDHERRIRALEESRSTRTP